MDDLDFTPLSVGSSSFKSLREEGQIYVDKTDLIYELAKKGRRRKIFLARPRRFGKSLLTSTFDSLFRCGLQNFSGLKIEKLWKDKTYNVVHLDFSEIKDFSGYQHFVQRFENHLKNQFGLAGFMPREDEPIVDQLSIWLQQLPSNSLVCLIDEYDAPLTACLGNNELFTNVRLLMSQFFSTLKSKDGCLRFLFMTGITKYSNTGIFSGFNIFTDISLSPKYGTLLGLTEDEIKTNYAGYLENAAETLGVAAEDVMNSLRENYDGFSFDRKCSTHVYCPWSVLNFLDSPEDGFDTYWYDSAGQPSVLMQFLANNELAEPSSYAVDKWTTLGDLKASREYSGLDLTVLLTQAGYLTIKEVDADQSVKLGYPNREVAVSMARLYSDKLRAKQKGKEPSKPLISDLLKTGSLPEVVSALNKTVESIDYQNYPICSEASCRAYIQVLLMGSGLFPAVEVHNALGRSDMEISIGGRHWVFEFKYAQKSGEVPSLLREAEEQIRSRRYGEHASGRELIRAALVFSGVERKFSAWEEVPAG